MTSKSSKFAAFLILHALGLVDRTGQTIGGKLNICALDVLRLLLETNHLRTAPHASLKEKMKVGQPAANCDHKCDNLIPL
jgi:hypothetical protein